MDRKLEDIEQDVRRLKVIFLDSVANCVAYHSEFWSDPLDSPEVARSNAVDAYRRLKTIAKSGNLEYDLECDLDRYDDGRVTNERYNKENCIK